MLGFLVLLLENLCCSAKVVPYCSQVECSLLHGRGSPVNKELSLAAWLIPGAMG